MEKVARIWLYLLALLIITSCDPMSEEEKKWIEEQAENGNLDQQYKITQMKEDYGHGDYVFGAKLAKKYEKSLLDTGYVKMVDSKIYESKDNIKEKLRWLKYGVSKGNGKHAHELGEIFESGEESNPNRELAMQYYIIADSLGYPISKLSILKMENKSPSLWTFVKSYYDLSYSRLTGSSLGKFCGATLQTSKELIFSPMSNIKWWQYLLIYAGMFVIAIIIGVANYRIESSVASGKSTGWILPLFAGYGFYNVVMMDFDPVVKLNIGHLFAVDGTFGDATLFATLPTWIMLIALLYAVYIIISSTISGAGMFWRFLMLAISVIYGVFFGAAISILAAVVFVLGIIKGGLFSGGFNNSAPTPATNPVSQKIKVDCPHKTLSGGCNLNNGWSCHVEKGSSSCPYGVREM